MNIRILLLLAGFVIFPSCGQQFRNAYQNPKLEFEERARDLVSRMTLEEKVSQLTNNAAAVDHLGIPEYNWWNECLHGVARAGKATVFPQAIGMAATFDRELMLRMADATSTEARAKYNDFISRGKRGIYQGLTFWSPNINIFRDPRWGRGHETYGEDPYLTGELAVSFIRGLQGEDQRYLKTVATAKHYAVHSGPEPLRHSFDAVISEADFRNTYLPAFRKSVREGRVYSVMCAYNRYMGDPCCGSVPLQEEILREELGFEGYIVSDCGAIRDFHSGHGVAEGPEEAAAMAVMSGTDLNCGQQFPSLVKAVRQGLIAEEEVDRAVFRLMLARMKLGMFDPEEDVPWSGIPPDLVAGEEHRSIALEMARKSVVLLKNDAGSLPLDRDLKKIAVIGPNANNTYVQLGNYNGSPVHPVSVYEGIRDKMKGRGEVRYALGSPHHLGMPYLQTVPAECLFTDMGQETAGLSARFYANTDWEGIPVKERVDSLVDIYWWDGEVPVRELTDDEYSVEWSGVLVPRRSGSHALGVYGKYFQFILEGDTLIKRHVIHHPNKTFRKVELVAGKPYRIRIRMRDLHGDASCTLHWEEPGLPLSGEASRLADWADHVVLVMGLTPRLEGEEMRGLDLEGFRGGDRTSLELPEVQLQLIRRILYTGKPLTLVIMSGSAVTLGGLESRLSSVVQAWYGGEAAGTAIADVLFGDYNPAGRLPVTFYKTVNDLPAFENYDMEGRTYRYFDGEVLFPFGHGLSYSRFDHRNLILEKNDILAGDSLVVSLEVTNNGPLDGEEVVQMYLNLPEEAGDPALISLCGFRRVFIPVGQSRLVTMNLGPGEMERYHPLSGSYRVAPGKYRIFAGPSSDTSLCLSTVLNVR